MTNDEAKPLVERWLPMMADRLWLRQFRLEVAYEHLPEDTGRPRSAAGECQVDHTYGEIRITIYLANIHDEEGLFRTLLHECLHGACAEYFYGEDAAIKALSGRKREARLVKDAFTYAHERVVSRLEGVMAQSYPYPDSWRETVEEGQPDEQPKA